MDVYVMYGTGNVLSPAVCYAETKNQYCLAYAMYYTGKGVDSSKLLPKKVVVMEVL